MLTSVNTLIATLLRAAYGEDAAVETAGLAIDGENLVVVVGPSSEASADDSAPNLRKVLQRMAIKKGHVRATR